MKRYLFKKKGAALAWVLMLFTVLMILMSSVMYIVRQNVFETAKQNERIEAYYIALAGVDLTYAALMDSTKNINTAITKLKANPNPITDTIKIINNGIEKGTVNVSIDRIKENEIWWLRITSIGNLKDNDTKVSSVMRINEENNNQMIREKISK